MEITNKVVKESKGYGIASLVLGIISIVLFLAPYITLPIAIAGFIFGIMQSKRGQTGLGVTGIVLNSVGGGIAIVFGLILLLAIMIVGL
jgi:hypothetical protein